MRLCGGMRLNYRYGKCEKVETVGCIWSKYILFVKKKNYFHDIKHCELLTHALSRKKNKLNQSRGILEHLNESVLII